MSALIQIEELPIGDKIALEAESWIGTPFRHQGNIKGRAVDCANFIKACMVAALGAGALRLVEPNEIPNNYRRCEDGVELLRWLSYCLDIVPTSQRARGHVLALCDDNLREEDVPRHLVIVQEVTQATTFIIDATAQGVRRHRMDARWMRRVHSVWSVHE